jgi:hypothetical protein
MKQFDLRDALSTAVDDVWVKYYEANNIKTGDISPEDDMELSKLLHNVEVLIKRVASYNEQDNPSGEICHFCVLISTDENAEPIIKFRTEELAAAFVELQFENNIQICKEQNMDIVSRSHRYDWHSTTLRYIKDGIEHCKQYTVIL